MNTHTFPVDSETLIDSMLMIFYLFNHSVVGHQKEGRGISNKGLSLEINVDSCKLKPQNPSGTSGYY